MTKSAEHLRQAAEHLARIDWSRVPFQMSTTDGQLEIRIDEAPPNQRCYGQYRIEIEVSQPEGGTTHLLAYTDADPFERPDEKSAR